VLDFGLAKSGSKPGLTEETLTKVLTTEAHSDGQVSEAAPPARYGNVESLRSCRSRHRERSRRRTT